MTQHVPTPPAPEELAAQRRQLLFRLVLAGVFIAALLLGLTVYDRLNRPRPQEPQAVGTVQLPPPQGPDLPQDSVPTLAAPLEDPLAEAALQRDAPPEPELTSAPELAAPGQRLPEPPPVVDTAPAGRLVLQGEGPRPPVTSGGSPPREAASRESAASAPGPRTQPKPVPGGPGYLIQLGVFSSPDNAEALLSRLQAQGIPAHLESRVVLGPFPTKLAAQAAQVRLRKAGESAGLVVPPKKR